MFFRTFVVELYQVPSGSMTPTLMGDYAARIDLNDDGKKDIVLFDYIDGKKWALKMLAAVNFKIILDIQSHELLIKSPKNINLAIIKKLPILHPVFIKTDKYWKLASPIDYLDKIKTITSIKKEYSHIIIAKYYYWFRTPKIGDVLMFKTPSSIYDSEKPKYIKRCCATQNQKIEIKDGHIYINGKLYKDNSVIANNYYFNRNNFKSAIVPEKHFFVLGDNSSSSYDSRYWGPVPYENIGGKAIFCFWPLSTFGFVK